MVDISPVAVPQISPNEELATIVEWAHAEGDEVGKGEVIATLETTKSVFEVSAPANGFLVPLYERGAEVPVTGTIALVSSNPLTRVEAEQWLAEAAREAEREPEESGSRIASERNWTYKAQIVAERHGVDLEEVPAGDGRISEEDVLRYVEQQAQPSPADYHDLMDDQYPTGRSRILIIGGGDGAVQVVDVLAHAHRQRAVAIVDDAESLQGKLIRGVPIVGQIDYGQIAQMYEEDHFDAAVISISTLIPLREQIFLELKERGIPFANVIHPSAVIGANVTLGEGNVIMAFCHIGPCATLGNNNFLSVYCSVEHHGTLGNHCSFGPGVVTSSRVHFGDRVRCGTGIFIEPKVTIGADAVIGSGCIIRGDVPEHALLKSRMNYTIRQR
ncbi:MAG: biotin/lipoyl-containing protein [Candidatus Promineifilaceae bacterium]|nr:biotin/lipoyl-containing protein [Candidatus Promineifilaceae bacterium]